MKQDLHKSVKTLKDIFKNDLENNDKLERLAKEKEAKKLASEIAEYADYIQN